MSTDSLNAFIKLSNNHSQNQYINYIIKESVKAESHFVFISTRTIMHCAVQCTLDDNALRICKWQTFD